MSDYDEIIHTSASIESQKLIETSEKEKNFLDYFSLAVTTFGVGYLPLMPGTWGSMVGVGIYILFGLIESKATSGFLGLNETQLTAWNHVFNTVAFLLFCLLGIWAASRATKLFKHKDPSQAVVDEVIGQLLTFLFIPFTFSWKMILAGFLLFRLFDIWKPYPIDSLQNLPSGIGVCADDLLAGVYAGVVLSIIYAISLTL